MEANENELNELVERLLSDDNALLDFAAQIVRVPCTPPETNIYDIWDMADKMTGDELLRQIGIDSLFDNE